jgi:hypothetical protein
MAVSRPLLKRVWEARMPVGILSTMIVLTSALLNIPAYMSEYAIDECVDVITGNMSEQIIRRAYTYTDVYRTR